MNRQINPEEWKRYLDLYGFCSGYAVFGLKMMRAAAKKITLIKSNKRMAESHKKYQHAYYLRNRERLCSYRNERYMQNIEEERAKRREYYHQHKDKWFKYRNKHRKENYEE